MKTIKTKGTHSLVHVILYGHQEYDKRLVNFVETTSRCNVTKPNKWLDGLRGKEGSQINDPFSKAAVFCTILLFAHRQRNARTTTMSKSKAAQQEKNQCSMPFLTAVSAAFF